MSEEAALAATGIYSIVEHILNIVKDVRRDLDIVHIYILNCEKLFVVCFCG